MARRKLTSYDILIVGIFTLLAAGSWVIFDVYRSLTKTTIPRILQRQIRPLDSTIELTTVDNLRSRRVFEDSYLDTIKSISAEPIEEQVPVTVVTPSPQSTQSAQPTPTLSPSPESTTSSLINLP